jgi:hypothetical protein
MEEAGGLSGLQERANMANEIGDQRTRVRTASCACGTLRVTTSGAPEVVNACSCFNCQKRSGSSFTYTAFFPSDAIKVEGETGSYREKRATGRWHEVSFCVTCGVAVISRLEVFPHLTGVAVGCFSDPGFDTPHGFYWAARRHHWLPAPEGVKVEQEQ